MTSFHEDMICRVGANRILVRLLNTRAPLDSPDRYKWLSATVYDGGEFQLFTVSVFGDIGDPKAMEYARTVVANFLASEEEVSDAVASAMRADAYRQIEADKKRRDNLLRRTEHAANIRETEGEHLEKKAADLGCTVALAAHIARLERRLEQLEQLEQLTL